MGRLTKEQMIFKDGKAILEQLDKIKEERPLTQTEKEQYEETQNKLFNTVVRFGMARARERMSRYRLSSDAYEEIKASIALMFFEQLPKYDPERATPTTFFLRYFDQCISEYLRKYSQGMTQNDAANVGLVRSAIQEFNAKGIKWTEEMLAVRTGLSIKIVRKALVLADVSIRADIDEMPHLGSIEPTPEEAYIENEKETEIFNAVRRELDDEEYEFFLYVANVDSKNKKKYTEVAEHFGMTTRDAKKKFNSIANRLGALPELQRYAHINKDEETRARINHVEGSTVMDVQNNMFELLANSKKNEE